MVSELPLVWINSGLLVVPENVELDDYHPDVHLFFSGEVCRRPAAQLHDQQARQAAQVIQASQLQSPGDRPGGQIMGLIPPNIKHKKIFCTVKNSLVLITTSFCHYERIFH